MEWKAGDTAICIKVGQCGPIVGRRFPPLRLNLEYKVHAVKTCECGSVSLDVGIGSIGATACNECGSRTVSAQGIWWCAASRFTKKLSKEERQADALKNEDYEQLEKILKEDA